MKLNNKWLCVLLALLLTLTAASALATGETEAPKLEIQVSISADVEPLTPDTYIVWLEAQTEGAPMPDGTEDGRFTMDRTGPGDIVFPELSFDYGVYTYQMGQTPGSHPSATAYDDTTYTITVIRPHVGNFSVVIESDKGEKVTDITFENLYAEISVSASKVWNDADNQDGKRDTVYFVLSGNTMDETGLMRPVPLPVETVRSIPADAEGEALKVTWEGLPVFYRGTAIDYTVTERGIYEKEDGFYIKLKDGAEYAVVIYGDMEDGFTVTNSYTPEETEATVKKIWDDGNNQDGIRPKELAVTLSDGTNVTLDEKGGWEATVTGLPKYKDGKEIVYTWSETEPDGYKLTAQSLTGTVTLITNTHATDTTSVSVVKIWDDNDNQDGVRPDSVSVSLYDGDTQVGDPVTLNEGNKWIYTWDNLPKNKGGSKIVYTWKEESVPAGYTLQDPVVEGRVTKLTNFHQPEEIALSVEKVWVDGENGLNTRPANVVITLSDGQTVVLTESNGWQATLDHLPKYEEGNEIVYTWKEEPVPGYTTSQAPKATDKNTTVFTNTIIQEKIPVGGTKTWVDGGREHDNAREITLILTCTSSKPGSKPQEADAIPIWTGNDYSFGEFDRFDPEGYEYIYEVTEAQVEDYDAPLQDGYDFTNTIHDNEDVEVTGTKFWVDGGKEHDNASEITLTLTRTSAKPGGTAETLDLSPVWDGGKFTYSGLDQYDDEGYEYTYDVAEAPVPGYETSKDGFDFTNTIEDKEDVEITGTKTWVDGKKEHDNAAELTLTLTRTSAKAGSTAETVDVSPAWDGGKYTFSGLDQYDEEGYEYTYEVTEAPVPGYDTVQNGFDFTNTVTQEDITVTGTKTWVDGGKEHDNAKEIKLTLTRTANGSRQTVTDVPVQWEDDTYSYSPLPRYDSDGYEYTYEVTEAPVPGYTTERNDFDFTNTIEDKEDVEITGKKTWVDGGKEHDNASELTLTLTRTSAKEGSAPETLDLSPVWSGNSYTYTGLERYDAEGYEYTYEVTEAPVPGYDTAKNGFNFTNTVTQEEVEITGTKTWVDGGKEHDNAKEIKLTLWRTANGARQTVPDVPVQWEGDTYTYSGLPKYDKSGYEYTYEVTEAAVPGYTTEQDDLNFTNTIEDKEDVEITGKKTWVDGGKEHDNASELTLTLTRTSAKEGSAPETLDVSPVWNGNNYAFTGLERYGAEGYEYTYDVTEAPVPGYDTAKNGFNFTNTVTQEEVEISGTKTWVDGGKEHDNAKEIKLTLWRTANGARQTVPDVPVQWEGDTYTYSGLPKYDKSGYEYTYEVTEAPVSGYTTEQNDFNFTNTIEDKEDVEITGTKTWVDGKKEHDNAAELTLTLTRTSAKEGSAPETLDVSPAWSGNSYAFTGLERYDAEGYEYTYDVTEAPVEGYTTVQNGFNFTNTVTQEEVEISGTKTWVDGGKQHDNASDVKLTLTRIVNGAKQTVPDVPVQWEGDTYTYSGLPKYDDSGYEYTYEVTETRISGYTTEQTGYDIINTITQKKIKVDGNKTWVDGKKEHDNASELTLTLTRTSAKPGSTEETLDVSPVWSGNDYAFEDLDQYDAEGYEYTYQVTEAKVPGYDTESTSPRPNCFNFKNTITQELIDITGTKTWVDGGQEHDNAVEITLRLTRTANGKEEPLTGLTPTWEGNTYTFSGLPKYDKSGYEYTYTISEQRRIPKYEEPVVEGFNITNTLLQEKITVDGTKTWIDGGKEHDNATELTLTLTRTSGKEGSTPEELDVSPAWDGSKYTFADLDRYDEERYEYIYEVSEAPLAGYDTVVDGFSITNTITQEEIEITGTKTWVDGGAEHDNAKEITLILTRTSAKEGSKAEEVTGFEITWADDTYTISGLPKYDAEGYEYTYTVSEAPIDNYTTEQDGNNFTNIAQNKEIAVVKIWEDNNNDYGLRPDHLDLILYGNGQEVEKITLSANDAFEGYDSVWARTLYVPFFDEDGQEIHYSWSEPDDIIGYESSIEPTSDEYATVFINTQITIKLTVRKIWVDRGYTHPGTLIMTLTGGGKSKAVTLNENNNWVETIVVPKYDADGNEIQYVWTEPSISNYKLIGVKTFGSGDERTTEFTNRRIIIAPPGPPTPRTPTPTPRPTPKPDAPIEDVGTPLGVGPVYLNIGDCLE